MALLKSSELPNTVEVQIKSASYELTIPEDFDVAWNIMESCRRNTQAHRLQAAAGENGNAFRTDTYVEVDEELQKAFGVDPNPNPNPGPHPHPGPHPGPPLALTLIRQLRAALGGHVLTRRQGEQSRAQDDHWRRCSV